MVSDIFNKMIVQKIKKTKTYKRINCCSIELLIEDMKSLDSFGGMVFDIPHEFLIYIQKLYDLEIQYSNFIEIVEENKKNPYILVTLLFYLRLSKDFKPNDYFRSYLKDYRKIRVIGINNMISYEYIDVLVDNFLEKDRVFSVYLKKY